MTGSKSGATHCQWEHDWTEKQICFVLDRVSKQEQLEQAFFQEHLNKQQSPPSILAEQQLCLEVLGPTPWMSYMIQDKRVIRDASGSLRLKGEQWPAKYRAISRLLDIIHPLSEEIKAQLGPYRSEAQLKTHNLNGYKKWIDWQAKNRYTWYFKYVAVRLRTNPLWLNQDVIPSSNRPSTSAMTVKQLEDRYNGSDLHHASGRDVPPHLREVQPRLADRLTADKDFSMNDIDMTPPPSVVPSSLAQAPVSNAPPTSVSLSEVDGHYKTYTPNRGTHCPADEGGVDGKGEELIAAMLMLMAQELTSRPSACMKGFTLTYNKKLSVPEQSAIYLIKKLGGKAIDISKTDTQEDTKRSLSDENGNGVMIVERTPIFILWSPYGNMGSLSGTGEIDKDKDDLPTPITLIGLVHLITARRQAELSGDLVDLLTD
ncbi:uncharacterized protein I303_106644 [Kwoniella dejecticola CBS 10117]|uniref:Uncharacterized protein n=1 Tax=Kwoniella dejecticola CBS 10117 TaxID=1296121 RepID=A0A1A5ZU36_9TREE|nr:uncharacterized protein I303_08713 [Kwoniella dejecticola CBS 10117]OBR81326.1 hypothetical protein I303_08713 [Kwoniella dejecticola CBS 10117]